MGLHGTNRNLSKACIAGVPEGEKQENEAGTVFEESVTEYFLKLIKDINPKNSNEEKLNSTEEKHKENHI